MKFPKHLRPQLLKDVELITEHLAEKFSFTVEKVRSGRYAPSLIAEINAHRSYGDDHPRWKSEKRVLPASHVNTHTWLNELYNTHRLNDATLETAINWACKELTP